MSLHCVEFAQKQQKVVYALNDCIEIAINNNFDLKKLELNAKTSKINFKESRLDILPNLNANYNLGMDNGPYVINHELVTNDGKETKYISIYKVEKGLITNVSFVREF